jgi:hypothetical protein
MGTLSIQTLVPNTILQQKLGLLEKGLIPGLELEAYKMSLQSLVVPESEEAFRHKTNNISKDHRNQMKEPPMVIQKYLNKIFKKVALDYNKKHRLNTHEHILTKINA